MLKILHITKKTIEEQSEKIFKPVRNGESAIGICFPGCKLDYNLSCYLADKKLLKRKLGTYYNRFVFVSVILEQNETYISFMEKVVDSLGRKYNHIKNKNDLKQIVSQIIGEGKEVHFFILNAESPDYEVLNQITTSLQRIFSFYNRVSGSIFFEVPIIRKEYTHIFQKNYKFLQNTITFPLYGHEETIGFIKNLAHVWKMKLDTKIVEEISLKTPGNVWLLREMVRYLGDNPHHTVSDAASSFGIQMRVEAIYNLFTSEEKQVLADVINHNRSHPTLRKYFESIGFIDSSGRFLFPPIIPYLKIQALSQKFEVQKGMIRFNGNDVTKNLTPLEVKLCSFFIEQKGRIISREEISVVIWGDQWEDKYSDWAIDRLIFRLRTKLHKMGAGRNILKTLKSRGFIFGT